MRPILQEAVDALPDWWERIDSDPAWRKYGEYGLAAGYGLIALVALIQLVRFLRLGDQHRGCANVRLVTANCHLWEPGPRVLILRTTRKA